MTERAAASDCALRRGRWRLALTTLAALLLVPACGDATAPPDGASAPERDAAPARAEAPVSRVILIGIDGLEWSVLAPLVRDGRVPNLVRFLTRGASGELHTTIPTYSPILWATIATGRTRDEHGIRGFLRKRADAPKPTPFTAADLRVRTVWDVLGAAGRRVAVVGWWTTWPARPVAGILVSDRMLYNRFNLTLGASGFGRDLPHQTWPEHFVDEVAALAAVRDGIRDEMFERFLPTVEDRDVVESLHDPYYELYLVYARDDAYLRILDRVRSLEPFDFLAFYLNGVDVTSHYFWKYRFPEQWPEPVDPALVRANGEVIDRYTIWVDGAIGGLLDEADEDTVVVLVSDHGFVAGRRPDTPNVSGIHYDRAPPGVVAIAGGHVRPGAKIEGASIFDVTPTILHLFGLPVASDMSGAVLPAAVGGRANLERRPVARIPTYEDGAPTPATVETEYDDAIIGRLEALGYLDDPSAIDVGDGDERADEASGRTDP